MQAFRAMNTDVQVIAPADEAAIAAEVAATFADAERRFSRFRADSELSGLNRSEGPFLASRELFEMLERARGYVALTDGLFDPAIGAALRALGYDRSFAPGALDRARSRTPPRRGHFRDVVLERDTRTVWRPPHVLIDLGGMAKGATVDLAARHLRRSGAIDAGGDAVLRGSGPTGEAWLVDVEDPTDPSRTSATIAISDAAVATTAANRRTWRVGHEIAHHLIDPQTLRAARSDLLQVTVVAAEAELADVLAKATFLLGSREARPFLERTPGVMGAVLVRADGAVTCVGELDLREVSHG
ncbi:MAG: FAD:protein FMN transferase [Polyangiaceae bacterium]